MQNIPIKQIKCMLHQQEMAETLMIACIVCLFVDFGACLFLCLLALLVDWWLADS